MASVGKDFASLEEMNDCFSRKISLARECLALRHLDDGTAEEYSSLEFHIEEAKGTLKVIRNKVKSGEVNLLQLQNLLKKLENINKRLDHMDKNFPYVLKQTVPEKKIKVVESVLPAAPKTNKGPAKLQCVTVAEFEAVPKYMKGRLKYEQLNKFIADFNTAIEGKYELMFMPRKAMKPADFKVYQTLKAQETADTKGASFCTVDDFKVYGKMKIDKMASNMLTILRHCSKIKEIRGPGPIVRYMVV